MSIAREKNDRRFMMRFQPSFYKRLEDIAVSENKDVTAIVRRAVQRELDNTSQADATRELLPINAPLITDASCGAFDEAIADTETALNVSADIAKELDLHEGDFFIRARGDSMAAIGITDGSLVTMEVLPQGRNPRANEIALVQIERSDGEYESTLKRWTTKAGQPVLLDGEGNVREIPGDAKSVKAVAVARSFIARI